MLTKADLELMDNIVFVLKPFYDATLEISYDDVCILLVIPLVKLLNAKLQSTTQHSDGLSQLKAALRDAMNKRFSNLHDNSNLIAATLMDPRFKDMYFSSQDMEKARCVILSFLPSRRTTASASVERSRDGNGQP